MARMTAWAAAAAAALGAVGAEAAPLQPTSPWNVNYTATSCDAKRRFGDVALVVTPAPLGETMRVMIEMPGEMRRARQYPARVMVGDGTGGEVATALLFPLSRKGLRGIYAVLPKATVERALANGELRLMLGRGTSRSKVTFTIADAHLSLGKTGALGKALSTCLADLQKHWGMTDGKLPEPAVPGSSIGSVTGIFRSDDYPEDAMDAGQSGTAQYLLMIGRQGEVMDCVIRQSSGIASLDAMGCQVIRERAKFSPAKDSAGKAIVGSVLTPTIRWVLE